jgi:hypothetical protein
MKTYYYINQIGRRVEVYYEDYDSAQQFIDNCEDVEDY